jgi:hypothetical protein
MAVWCASTIRVTRKVAFTAGSSTHRKALRGGSGKRWGSNEGGEVEQKG